MPMTMTGSGFATRSNPFRGPNLIWNDRCQCLLGGGGPVEGPKATDEAGRFDDESL